MLNELEVSYWHMINYEIKILRVQNQVFLQRLMMTALLAKKMTTTVHEFEVFTNFLYHNNPKVMHSYNQWLQTLDKDFCDKLSLIGVNECFRNLFAEYPENDVMHSVD